jgi:hypothetical protein
MSSSLPEEALKIDEPGAPEEENQNKSTMHFLPCTIDYNGPAPVNSFFHVSKVKINFKSALRGRELIGTELQLTDGVVGINAVQSKPIDNTETVWNTTGEFDKIMIWQHDLAPDLVPMQDLLDWFAIADKVRVNT